MTYIDIPIQIKGIVSLLYVIPFISIATKSTTFTQRFFNVSLMRRQSQASHRTIFTFVFIKYRFIRIRKHKVRDFYTKIPRQSVIRINSRVTSNIKSFLLAARPLLIWFKLDPFLKSFSVRSATTPAVASSTEKKSMRAVLWMERVTFSLPYSTCLRHVKFSPYTERMTTLR